MHRLGAIASSGCLCLCAGDLPPVAVEIAEECSLGLFGVVLMRSSSPQDEVELAVKDESELLLVGMPVERRGPSSFGLVTIPRLHEFADGGLDKLLRVCRARVLLHLRNFVKRHRLSLHLCLPASLNLPLLQGRMNI